MLPFAKALSPAYFRFGGTSADLTVFNASMTYENIRKDTYNHFTFTGFYENITIYTNSNKFRVTIR